MKHWFGTPYAPGESALIALLLIVATAFTLLFLSIFDMVPKVEHVITLDLPPLERAAPTTG